MNQIKRDAAHSYFESKLIACKARIAALSADDRPDEAVFARVELNVYDIFNTILSVAEKSAGDEDEKLVQFYLSKLQQIPQNWHTALYNAEQHGDIEKAYIEQIKLAAVGEIRQTFEEIWEVGQ